MIVSSMPSWLAKAQSGFASYGFYTFFFGFALNSGLLLNAQLGGRDRLYWECFCLLGFVICFALSV